MSRSIRLTDFSLAVLCEVSKIPRGETRTYAQVAKAVGHPNASRAVGTVLRKNPLPKIIPCHRVIKSEGRIGNYSGRGGPRAKRLLLKKEGALLERK